MSDYGQRFESPAGAFKRKTGNINVCTFWSSLQIFGSDAKLSHLDQQSERLDIQISKKTKKKKKKCLLNNDRQY